MHTVSQPNHCTLYVFTLNNNRKEKTTPFGGTLMRSQVLHQAAQHSSPHNNWEIQHSLRTKCPSAIEHQGHCSSIVEMEEGTLGANVATPHALF